MRLTRLFIGAGAVAAIAVTMFGGVASANPIATIKIVPDQVVAGGTVHAVTGDCPNPQPLTSDGIVAPVKFRPTKETGVWVADAVAVSKPGTYTARLICFGELHWDTQFTIVPDTTTPPPPCTTTQPTTTPPTTTPPTTTPPTTPPTTTSAPPPVGTNPGSNGVVDDAYVVSGPAPCGPVEPQVPVVPTGAPQTGGGAMATELNGS